MQTFTLEAEVSSSGMIHLDVPVGFPPGKVQIVLVVDQPSTQSQCCESATPFITGLEPKEHSINGVTDNELKPTISTERQSLSAEFLKSLESLKNVTWEEFEEVIRDVPNRR